MAILTVPDMLCESCLARINEAFWREKIKFSASVNTRTLSVEGDESVVRRALGLLEEMGFDAARQED